MRALLLVDIQTDFMPGGALAVPDGDAVVPAANHLMIDFEWVAATQDWHPPGHFSFASSHPGRRPGEELETAGGPQTLWPDHCVQGSVGAALDGRLAQGPIHAIFRKGTDPSVDSYSAFFDHHHRRSTGLNGWLRGLGVREVHLVGLATDYCILYTALDALSLGFEVVVHRDGVRAVEMKAGDGDAALGRIAEAGGMITS